MLVLAGEPVVFRWGLWAGSQNDLHLSLTKSKVRLGPGTKLQARPRPSRCWAGTGSPRRHWAGANWAKRAGPRCARYVVGAAPARASPPPAGFGFSNLHLTSNKL